MSLEEARTAQRERFEQAHNRLFGGDVSQFRNDKGGYFYAPAQDRWLTWQAAEASGLREAARIADEIAKEVGGEFADTHRLNVGLNKFRSEIRERAREVEG